MEQLKILVVDDEERMRKLVNDFLTRKQYKVVEAADGEEAINLFIKNNDFDLIILDVMMPKMDGWEVCREIRKLSKVPIIMLTAKSEESDELLGFELGVDEYISKPFSPRILVARVDAILRRTNNIDQGEIEQAGDIEIKGVDFRYGTRRLVLEDIDISIKKGQKVAFVGESGSGKTTLLNCIATVIKPTSGQILLSGVDISSFDGTKLSEYRGNKIGYLFQDFALLDNLTGKENILLPLSIHNVAMVTAEKKLNEIASFLGITDVLSKLPSQMSGGQKQRVAAARCLISDPDIILADEPTGALDTKLMEKLYEINQKEEHTILMVTHDPNAASFCSRILFIQDGVIFHELRRNIFEETREDFYSRILQVMAQLGGGSANVL